MKIHISLNRTNNTIGANAYLVSKHIVWKKLFFSFLDYRQTHMDFHPLCPEVQKLI